MDVLSNLFKSIPFLGFFAAALLAWYFYIKARSKERMALIEKGIDLSKFYTSETRKSFPWLGVGVVITGICIGLLLVFALVLLFPDDDLLLQMAQPGLILVGVLFGGFSMILVHFIYKHRKK
jgi:hypothetical protein